MRAGWWHVNYGWVLMMRRAAKPPAEKAWEVAPDVYCLGTSGITQTTVYFVRSGSSWVLIDAGWASDGLRIQKAAEALFGHGSRAAAILLTHEHPDHDGAALELCQ